MRYVLAVLLAVHGLIHLLGPAKAFHWAEVPQLRQPVAPRDGALWLAAAVLLVAASVVVALGARWWWIVALPGVVLSQRLIVGAWGDAKYGTVANVILALLILAAAGGR